MSNFVSAERFWSDIWESVWNIKSQLDIAPVVANPWWEWVKDFLIFIWQKIILPVSIIIWLVVVIIWFYNLFFSEKDDEQKKWLNFITWWVIWIIAMWSAWFIWKQLVWESWGSWSLNTFSWNYIADSIYSNIAFPFIKLAIFLVVWILFMILLVHAFKFVTNPSDDTKKHSKTIIIWNTIWIVLILWAKNLVELIYGKIESVSWTPSTNLWDIWQWILAQKNAYFAYNAINWIMWFMALITVIIIIYQTYLLLTKPEDADTAKKLKKNFVYIFIWILVIWAGYLITNFFIIK